MPAEANREARAFPVGSEPPAHWLERVRAGAPQLLVPPEDGGTPWVAVGQSPALNFEANPAIGPFSQRPHPDVHAAGESEPADNSARAKQRQAEPAREAQQARQRAGRQAVASEKTGAGKSAARQRDATGSAAPAASERVNSASEQPLSLKRLDRAQFAEPPHRNDGTSRGAGDARKVNDSPGATDAARPGKQDSARIPAMADAETQTVPARRNEPEINSARSSLRSPAELWPEIFAQPVPPPPNSRFDERDSRSPQDAPFPEIPGAASSASSGPDTLRTRPTAASRFPHVPMPATARPASGRSMRTAIAGVHWTEDAGDLWPDLPSAPQHTLTETGAEIRHWERTMRLDREQRGEF